MRKLEKNTRRYFVNLFADYILSKFNKSENTITAREPATLDPQAERS